MENKTEYILDFSYTAENQIARTIKVALVTFQEKLWKNNISFLEREMPIGNIFGKVTLHKKNILASIKSQDVMKQILWVIWQKKFKDWKLKYEIDIT